uniref:RING-type domain-containing protein n=1 Tax=Strigops habroptila TaxID=2489341 RepID=A0A672U517_STRHB
MGFDPSRFAAPVAAELQCKLCGRVLEEPLSTPCGHVFCAGCLLPWAARRRRCPLGCRPLAAAELRPVLPLRSLVQKLEVKCDYSPRGCGRTVRLRELPAHLAACRYGPPPGSAEPQPRGGTPPGRSGGGSADINSWLEDHCVGSGTAVCSSGEECFNAKDFSFYPNFRGPLGSKIPSGKGLSSLIHS